MLLGICEERGYFGPTERRYVEDFAGKARKSAFIFTKALQGDERMSAYLRKSKILKTKLCSTTSVTKAKTSEFPLPFMNPGSCLINLSFEK